MSGRWRTRRVKPIGLDLEHLVISRRRALALGGGAMAAMTAFALLPRIAGASPKKARAKLAELVGGVEMEKGRVNVELPSFTDRGPFTRIVVDVDSPMTPEDHVEAVHIVAERNTVPDVASFYLGPHNGVARVSTRIRLVKSQTILAAAQMSDGTVHLGRARTKVSRGGGGCG